jgi:hypothetical protein
MIEIADIFREFGGEYRKSHRLPMHMHKVMNAIENCRTAVLGGHIDECENCGHIKVSYNSCRNRHCPKCQGLAREKWLKEQKRDLLSTHYFHIVFTIPDILNQLALRNQREVYSILFKACSETLLELALDKKYLGAKIGFISILHTWGQNLMDHPHIHCIVPGGGLAPDERSWISTRKEFLIPVRVLSRLFRGKFLAYLKGSYNENKLKFEGKIKTLKSKYDFQKLIDKLYRIDWVVYCKPPFKNPEHVLEYLGRYTHRVAISNSRITDINEGKVTFIWKDYSDGNKDKLMTLDASEFIRRFLLHVLPDNYVKIRHYGILSNRNRKTKINLCRTYLGITEVEKRIPVQEETWEDTFLRLTGVDMKICPCCGKRKMVRRRDLNPRYYVPPDKSILIV